MGKYELETVDEFVRICKSDGVKKLAILKITEQGKELHDVIGVDEQGKEVKYMLPLTFNRIIITGIKVWEDMEDHYFVQEITASGHLSNQKENEDFKAIVTKRTDEVLALIQKNLPEARLYQGRIFP